MACSPEEFVFPPDSILWEVSRENALLAGGPAAAILQVAHPQIAAGVAAHSDFRRDALGRLHRTLDAVYTVTFGTGRDAEALRERIHAIHRRVEGSSPVAYSAFDPDAQLWVLATLIAVGLGLFERVVRPLTRAERESHYRAMRVFGGFFGLDPGYGPQSERAFREYYRAMLDGDVLASHPLCGEVARSVLLPAAPLWLNGIAMLTAFATVEILPSPLRERLGFRSAPAARRLLALALAALRMALPFVPPAIRYVAPYRRRVRIGPMRDCNKLPGG